MPKQPLQAPGMEQVYSLFIPPLPSGNLGVCTLFFYETGKKWGNSFSEEILCSSCFTIIHL